MTRAGLFVSLLIFTVVARTLAQCPPAAPAQAPRKETTQKDEVVRVTTNLVQIDVGVFDQNAQPVADLKPEDFEIREDNKAQTITTFSYVSSGPAAARPAANSAGTDPTGKSAPPLVAPANLTRSDVKRTMAIVLDDISLSLESIEPLRTSLRKFVDTQMQPGDLVAFIRTSGGMGFLQQFTTDKRQLYAAINNLRWNPNGRGGATSAATMEGRYESTDEVKDLQEYRSEILTAGTFGALSYVIRGLKELPGRKSIVFFGESFNIISPKDRNTRLMNAMDKVVDEANRAAVVIYTQDASGLQPLNYTAADSSTPGSNDISVLSLGGASGIAGHDTAEAGLARLNALSDRRNVEYSTHQALSYLAERTGGTFSFHTNDMNASLKSAVENQGSYYLIGYRPDQSVFDAATGRQRFHKWDIRVKRPGVKVRHRSGFFGVPDEDRKEVALGPEAELTKALISPFSAGAIHVRLTSLFRGDATGSSLTSLVHVDARDLSFKELPDGTREAQLEVIAMTFSDNGRVVDQVARTQTIHVRPDTYQRFLQSGLAYNVTIPVKKPGAYQLRVAVRDAGSALLGSAGQFVEVPDLSKSRLQLSSIVITGTDPKAVTLVPATSAGGENDDQFEQQIGSAVRKLRYGMLLDYGFVIYNAQLDRTGKQPQLQTQIRLLRDGHEVFAGKLNPFDPSGQTDLKQLVAGGRLQVGGAMIPGDYILQVIVTDQLAKEKFRSATQWIDFEVVK